MQKPSLFATPKSFVIVVLLLLILFGLHLVHYYKRYTTLKELPFYFSDAVVAQSYLKDRYGRDYQLLKLKSDKGFTFFMNHFGKSLRIGERVKVKFFVPKQIDFIAFMKGFFAKGRIVKRYPLKKGLKSYLEQEIAKQHQNKVMANFYQAIFLATPLDKTLRERISALGVSHLVALSGFHLGLLWGMLFALFYLPYRLFHAYYPYRLRVLDVGVASLLVLGGYLYLTDAPPSLVRSYVMLLLGWSALVLSIKVVDFALLVVAVTLILVLYPPFLFSLGFWLSVAGVFAIFLLLNHFGSGNKWLLSFVVIPIGVFILMVPVVHYTFDVTSYWQLASPLLSLLFVPFYPVALVLHLFGAGDLFDGVLGMLFSQEITTFSCKTPKVLLWGYIALALMATVFKRAFWLLLCIVVLFTLYCFLF